MALAHRTLPARGALGCVLTLDEGIYGVWTSRGLERASMSGGLLAAVARNRDEMPAAGDWVELMRWGDGRLTLTGRAGRSRAPRPSDRPHLRLVR